MFKVQQNTELSFSKHNPLLPQSLNSTQLEETVEGSLYDYPDTNGSLFIKIDQDRINDIRSEHEPWAQNTNLEISAIFGTLNLSLNGINQQNSFGRGDTLTRSAFPMFNLPSMSASVYDASKPNPFLGAFTHTQPQSQLFNINIEIPSIKSYDPFVRLFSSPNEQVGYDTILPKSLIEPQHQAAPPIDSSLYYFEKQSSQQSNQQDMIDEASFIIKQAPFAASESLLEQYDQLLQPRSNILQASSAWEQTHSQRLLNWSTCFEVYRDRELEGLQQLQLQLNRPEDVRRIVNDRELIGELSKMLQGFESELFVMDYSKREWRVELRGIRLEHSFRTSFEKHIADLLAIANAKSRIEAATQFAKLRQFRSIYLQIFRIVETVFNVFDEILLQSAKTCTLLEFILAVLAMKREIDLLYRLLLDKAWIVDENKCYLQFDHSFLNAEFTIFNQIVKLAKQCDILQTESDELVKQLLNAAFKPIIFAVNRIAFEDSCTIPNKDKIYLKYYFDNINDISTSLSNKTDRIRSENNELYLICKTKEKMEIVNTIEDLIAYQNRWDRLFKKKHRMIEQLKRKQKKQIRLELERKYEERMKEIYQLKMKTYLYDEEEKKRKKSIADKNRKEIERLKKEIEEKQQRRRLKLLIEKEKEKGFLLETQLQEKVSLLKQKQQLLGLQKTNVIVVPAQETTQTHQLLHIPSEKQSKQLEASEQLKPTTSPIFKPNPIKISSPQPANSVHQINSPLTHRYLSLRSLSEQSQLPISQSSSSSQSSDEADQPPHILPSQTVNTATCLQICIDQVIRKQTAVIDSAINFLVFDKYRLVSMLQFMKRVFMSGDGRQMQQFMSVAINRDSMINLNCFNQCLLFDQADDNLLAMLPEFYQMKAELPKHKQQDEALKYYHGVFNSQINILQDNLEQYIGFQFRKLPGLLEQYFSYIHLSKYMQIFTFVLRIKHCGNIISEVWKQLNCVKKSVLERAATLPRSSQMDEQEDDEDEDYMNQTAQQDSFNLKMLNKLFATRYIIQTFLNTFQNFFFFRVIEKEYKTLRQKLGDANEELQMHHIKMLDNIIRLGFIDNPANNISKEFRRLLGVVRQFTNIVETFCADDVLSDAQQQFANKVDFVDLTFRKNQRFFENLKFKS